MTRIALLALSVALLPAQTFTVASVKLIPASERGGPFVINDPGRIDYRNLTLKTLIGRAYNLKDYQISGPDWISNEHYSVAATMPGNTSDDASRVMLQNLLAERFQIKSHRVPREMPVYVLAVDKNGPKFKPGDGGEMKIQRRNGRTECANIKMWNLANILGALLDRPVLDQTKLDGVYDLTLEFAPDAMLGPGSSKMAMEQKLSSGGEPAQGPSLFTALKSQLGLKLDPRNEPVEVLVIDSASKTPVEN